VSAVRSIEITISKRTANVQMWFLLQGCSAKNSKVKGQSR